MLWPEALDVLSVCVGRGGAGFFAVSEELGLARG